MLSSRPSFFAPFAALLLATLLSACATAPEQSEPKGAPDSASAPQRDCEASTGSNLCRKRK
jgi:hypothetical protein